MYQRKNISKSVFYYISSTVLLFVVIYATILKKFDYALFALLGFIPIEIFLFPSKLVLTEIDISITQSHLFGLYNDLKKIQFSQILTVHPVMFFDGYSTTEEDGSFPVYPGNGQPPNAIYQITYSTDYGVEKKLKVNLSPNEANILQEKITRL